MGLTAIPLRGKPAALFFFFDGGLIHPAYGVVGYVC